MFRTPRIVLAFLAVLGTAAVVMPAPAEAASAEVKAQKTQVKIAKKDLKSFQKIRKKWESANSKGKSTSKADADLETFLKMELGELRKRGISSKKDKSPEGKDTWAEQYRNALVTLRESKSPDKKKTHLARVEQFLKEKLDRQEKRLAKLG